MGGREKMRIVLNGMDVECSVEEFVELQKRGFFAAKTLGDIQKFEEKDVIEVWPPVPKTKAKKVKSIASSRKYKHFTKAEDKIILDVWSGRKNNIRLTAAEYAVLEKGLPGRTRDAISGRLWKLRHENKLF
jgi:hypothetical protein